MAKYRWWTRNPKTKKTYALSGTFKTKKAGLAFVKKHNKGMTKYAIGGRGFSDRKNAEKWLKWRIKNPPIGYTATDVRKSMKISKIPVVMKSFIKKER